LKKSKKLLNKSTCQVKNLEILTIKIYSSYRIYSYSAISSTNPQEHDRDLGADGEARGTKAAPSLPVMLLTDSPPYGFACPAGDLARVVEAIERAGSCHIRPLVFHVVIQHHSKASTGFCFSTAADDDGSLKSVHSAYITVKIIPFETREPFIALKLGPAGLQSR
jgi:hypothetical protein